MSVDKNIEKFLNKISDENGDVDFEKIENISTRCADTYEEHYPHTLIHIEQGELFPESRKKWGIKKITDACNKEKNGCFTPSWFISKETASDYLFYILLNSKLEEYKKLSHWIDDRDLNYNNRKKSRLSFSIEYNEITGYAMAIGTNYDKDIFPCHKVTYVFEYTTSHNDGEFNLYDMYPSLSKADENLIRQAQITKRKNRK